MKAMILVLAAYLLLPSLLLADEYEDAIESAFMEMKADTYPAKAFTKVLPYAVGQWVMYGQIDDDGDKSLFKMSIIGKDGDVWILESWTMTEDGINAMQMSVKGMEKAASTGSVEDIEITKVRIKSGDNEPMTIEGFILDLSAGIYRDAMKSWFQQSTEFSTGGPVMVPCGMFAGTTKANTDVVILGDEIKGTGWLYPDVPIYGMVKSTNDEGYSMVLLDYGTRGATSSFR